MAGHDTAQLQCAQLDINQPAAVDCRLGNRPLKVASFSNTTAHASIGSSVHGRDEARSGECCPEPNPWTHRRRSTNVGGSTGLASPGHQRGPCS